jgi:phage-related protein
MSISIDSYETTYTTSKSSQHNVKETAFGDGYRQTALDGINYQRENWSVEFVPIDSTAANALEVILLNSRSGLSNVLSWTPNGESTTKYWTAHDISKTPNSESLWTVTCTLRREFPLT